MLVRLGLVLTLPLSFGPLTLGPVTFELYWMLLGLSLSILGLQCVYMGILSQIFFDWDGASPPAGSGASPTTAPSHLRPGCSARGSSWPGSRWNYVHNGFSAAGPARPVNHLGATGLLLTILGFMTFTFTLILHSTAVAVRRKP